MNSPLNAWREELRRLIPRGFLRRDQGDGLFVSDYPRHGEEAPVSDALRQAGYTVGLRGSLAHVDGGLEKYCALTEGLPEMEAPLSEEFFWLCSLANHLQKTGAEITADNLEAKPRGGVAIVRAPSISGTPTSDVALSVSSRVVRIGLAGMRISIR